MDQIDSLEYYIYNVMKRILRRNCVSCKYSNLLAINQLFTSKTATARDKLLPKALYQNPVYVCDLPYLQKKKRTEFAVFFQPKRLQILTTAMESNLLVNNKKVNLDNHIIFKELKPLICNKIKLILNC